MNSLYLARGDMPSSPPGAAVSDFTMSKNNSVNAADDDENPDKDFFDWMENSGIALTDLDGAGFEKVKKKYLNQPPATPSAKAANYRWTDEMLCQALEVTQEELELIAEYAGPQTGDGRWTFDEVEADDDDGCIGTPDMLYLAQKRDFMRRHNV